MKRFPLGKFVAPRVDDARLARQWGRIDERLQGGRAGRWSRALPRGFALVAVALIVVVALVRRRSATLPPAVDGVVLETPIGQEQTLTLPEGSRIALESASRVRLAHVAATDVRLELEQGAVRLEVTHVEGRRFVVVTHDVAVRVVGTRFRVGLTNVGTMAVSVEDGRVEVARGGVVAATIAAGETWSAPVGVAPSTATPTTPVVTEPSVSSTPPKRPATVRRKLPPAFHERFREGDYAGAFAVVESEDFDPLVRRLDGRDLLELAIAARLSGNPTRAARALDHLRRNFRGDPRAGLAALDLGRLRLDELNDPAGALAALDDAIALPLSEALKEDAEARRVQALDRMGDLAACTAARDAYLLQHPEGVHTTSVARRCKPH